MAIRIFTFQSGRAVFDGAHIVEYPSGDFDSSIADSVHSRLISDENADVTDLLVFGSEELS